MARDAGFRFADEEDPLLANHAEWQRRLFERFAALVAAAEREACAKLCEAQITGGDYHYLAISGHWDDMAQAATNCAAAIRARNNT